MELGIVLPKPSRDAYLSMYFLTVIKSVFRKDAELPPVTVTANVACLVSPVNLWISTMQLPQLSNSISHGEKMGLEFDPYLGSNHGACLSQ